MTPNVPKEVLQRYLNGNCSTAEKMLVDCWYAQLEATGDCEWEPGEKERLEQYLALQLRSNIQPADPLPIAGPAPVGPIRMRPVWWAAAAVLIFSTATWLLVSTKSRSDIRKSTISHTADIAAGHNGAILTLSDGRQLLLDSMGNGTIARQDGVAVVLKDGELSYSGGTPHEMAWNTIHTPKGRQFMLRLPDGTKAWLNAASTITYPTAFNGKERSIKISGEVYFEIAANTKIPFRVNVNEQAAIEVLGTHFNVNAYENGPHIATTLLEGAVRVGATIQGHGTGNSTVLQPGQQARIQTNVAAGGKNMQVITVADPDQVIAWKNGIFNFEGASLREMMQQVERWYDITVVFEKGVPDIHFAGKINKSVSLNGILKALDESGIHYRMGEQRQLVLLP